MDRPDARAPRPHPSSARTATDETCRRGFRHASTGARSRRGAVARTNPRRHPALSPARGPAPAGCRPDTGSPSRAAASRGADPPAGPLPPGRCRTRKAGRTRGDCSPDRRARSAGSNRRLPGGPHRRRCDDAPQWGAHTSLPGGRSGTARPSPLALRGAVTGASGGGWLQLVSPWSFHSLPLVQKIPGPISRGPVVDVHRAIHAAHRRVRNAARELRQHRPQPGISFEDLLPNDDGALVRWEIALVILQDDELGTRQHSIGCVGGGHLNPFTLKGRIEQSEVHRHRGPGQAQPVGLNQPVQAVGPLGELVSHTQAPRPGAAPRLAESLQALVPGAARRYRHGGAGAYHQGEGVVEPERREPLDAPGPMALPDALERYLRVLDGRLLQHGRERGPGVLGIQVDGAAFQRFVSQQGTSEIEFPVHFEAQAPFDMARYDLPEQHLFREILRPDDQARPGRTSGCQRGHQEEYRRSIHPSASSAAIAISAAGTAPARIVFVSAMAMPRKTKVPNPPPPMAAAMVAVPIVVTVAMRIPARMVGNASGSSTPQRI